MTKVRTRAGIALLAGAALALTGCGTTQSSGGDPAENYPSKAVQYIIPFDPGGESDVTARLQQPALEETLGKSVSVSNRPGGGGAVGWSELATSIKPDGHTLMGANLPHIVLQPLARDDAGYETEQIKWAYIFESTPNALVVAKDSPYKTVEEFVQAAKDKKLTVGGSSSFSANHIGTLALNKAADINLTYVPFSGTGAATPALLGGQVDALMTYNTEALNLKEQGGKVLAVASEEPLPELPNAPTFKEAGYDVVQGAWRGVAVPPDTPDAIVQKVADAFEAVNKDPDVKKKMQELGFHIEDMGPEEAKKFTQEQKAEAEDLLKRFDLLKK
ncbi:tripartite tricarboxylate transporter substrate binding protein [Arthrobacter pigmenti]